MEKKAGAMISLIGKKKSSGFLFIELLISVLVMSIGLVAVLNSFIQSLRAIEYSNNYFQAGLFLEDKAFEIYNGDKKEGFSRSLFNSKFSWELNIVKLEEIALNEISLKVLWNDRNKECDASVFTCL